jgi:hypothetical protein
MASTRASAVAPIGPVLFAYDGTELATLAIVHAAGQLKGGDTRWSSAFGSRPTSDLCPSTSATSTQTRLRSTAGRGGNRRPRSIAGREVGVPGTEHGSPDSTDPEGIVHTAETHKASPIVLGSHHRTGFMEHLLGASPLPSQHTQQAAC